MHTLASGMGGVTEQNLLMQKAIGDAMATGSLDGDFLHQLEHSAF